LHVAGGKPMTVIKNLLAWWRVKGKVYALYVLLFYLALSPFLKQIPAITKYLPGDQFGYPMIAACLYLMVQIFMGILAGEDRDVALLKFEEITDDFKKRLKSATQLDLLCSSSESFYPVLKETFATRKIECRMLLRHPLQGNQKQKNAMQHYSERYAELVDENKECHLTIKYCMNTFSRIILIDNVEVYFGFYRLENGRLRANEFEMIHAKSGSYFGNFILNIAKNRFQSVWDTADDELNERSKLVY
jgi:hypothetical protein